MIFHKKAKRQTVVARSAVFWWQGGLLAIGILLIWSQMPWSIVRHGLPPLERLSVKPRAAFVQVDPAFARAQYKKLFSAWFASPFGLSATGLDLGGITMDLGLKAPSFLGRGRTCPRYAPELGGEAPAPELAEVELPGVRADEAAPQPRTPGMRVFLSPELSAVRFRVPVGEDARPAIADGCYRFFVETDSEGRVAHLLLLTEPSGGAAEVERVVERSRASGSARGLLVVECVKARD